LPHVPHAAGKQSSIYHLLDSNLSFVRGNVLGAMIPKWLVWAALASVSYSAWAVLAKYVGDAVDAAHGQALSTLGMLPMIAALALLRRPADPGKRRRGILVALLGGVCSSLGDIPFFTALAGGKSAAVVSITALYPLATVLLAFVLLRERLGPIQLAGIPLSLAAIYVLSVREEQALFSPLALVALLPVVLWGVAGFLQKVSTNDVSGNTSAVWFLSAFVPLGIAIVLWRPLPANIPMPVWLLTSALGFALAFGNFAVIVAYAKDGKASVITPLVGLYPVLSVPVSIWLFDETIGWREILGISLAVVGILALSRESKPPTENNVP
jgi:drug/metabolite transporter (DMT)-like permease